ncbi:MAG: hypothetical protein KTR20_11515 [Cellvibrionaceae bacterium]|nr:hypothetical protein [Cellvibrionaceae bacterium]
MDLHDIASTACAFIPVYCYYSRTDNEEKKTPILMMDQSSFLLKAIIIGIDPSVFTQDELKDQFLVSYYRETANQHGQKKSLDHYDIYPQLVTTLHTDDEEISIYVCELYENSENYFKKKNRSNVTDYISYKEGVDELIKGGALEPLTEKILIALSEEGYISKDNQNDISNVQLF